MQILGEDDFNLVTNIYNTVPGGNFHDESTRKLTGNNILHLTKPLEDALKNFGAKSEKYLQRFTQIKQKLYENRLKRIPPLKDTKIITNWNGLMIAALAKSARIDEKNREKYIKIAESSVNYILENHTNRQGILIHENRGVPKHQKSFSEDYAFFIFGLIELYQTTLTPIYLHKAVEFQNQMIELFWDTENYGFFFTPIRDTELFSKQKPLYDGAIPSANSVSVYNLFRLYHLCANVMFFDHGENLMKVYGISSGRNPTAFSFFLIGLEYYYSPAYLITLAGIEKEKSADTLRGTLDTYFLPHIVVLGVRSDTEVQDILELNPNLENMIKNNEKPIAYICESNSCQKPTSDPQELLQKIMITPR